MAASKDTLTAAVDRLEQTVSGDASVQGSAWADRMEEALSGVEEAVRERAECLRSDVVPVDRPRLPSPAVDRRAGELRQQLERLLEEARALRSEVRGAAQAFGVGVTPPGLAGALSVAPEAGALPDLGVFRRRVRQLLEALRRCAKEEADLVLESVNTDIGAGD